MTEWGPSQGGSEPKGSEPGALEARASGSKHPRTWALLWTFPGPTLCRFEIAHLRGRKSNLDLVSRVPLGAREGGLRRPNRATTLLEFDVEGNEGFSNESPVFRNLTPRTR
jgi:hypothetical protein